LIRPYGAGFTNRGRLLGHMEVIRFDAAMRERGYSKSRDR
jgi:hypothetical protein